jgi:glycosyltransferase involved in cell wall biosynthesis
MDAKNNSVPVIASLPTDSPRPSLSVMIPTREPGSYLVGALRSVLRQALGPEQMQIAVVDDASRSDVQALIEQADGQGRVELHTTDTNRGISGNWNQCLKLARGHIVHLLHQDDLIEDGFYHRMLPPFSRHPELGMAFCRHAFIDSQNRTTRVSHREKWFAGVLGAWLERIATKQRVQCPAVLVRRAVYESVGGYRTDLRYALDWEMWVRIAARYEVWYEPNVLASYRRHEENESTRLLSAGKIGHDVVNAIELIGAHLPAARRNDLLSEAYTSFAHKTLKRLQREARASNDINALLEPVKIALGRVTQHGHDAERLKLLLAQIEQTST